MSPKCGRFKLKIYSIIGPKQKSRTYYAVDYQSQPYPKSAPEELRPSTSECSLVAPEEEYASLAQEQQERLRSETMEFQRAQHPESDDDVPMLVIDSDEEL